MFIDAIGCLGIPSGGQVERLVAPREKVARSIRTGEEQPMLVVVFLLRSSDRGPAPTVARDGHVDVMTTTPATGTDMPTDMARGGIQPIAAVIPEVIPSVVSALPMDLALEGPNDTKRSIIIIQSASSTWNCRYSRGSGSGRTVTGW